MGCWASSTEEPTAGPTAARMSARRSKRETKNKTRELEPDHGRLEAEAAGGRPGGAAVGRGRLLSEPTDDQDDAGEYRLPGTSSQHGCYQPAEKGHCHCER